MAKQFNDLWENILLKKCIAADLNNTLTISDDDSERKYQIFEVLVTETLARLYKDFNWKTSPVQKDGGVDFIAEKKLNASNKISYFPQLVIYGQIKRRNTSISEKLVLDATSNIIRYYRKNAIQEKCLYEIMHIFSTDKKIISEIKTTIENIDNLHYCVRIINADYLFKIWFLNKDFVHSIIGKALSPNELNFLDECIEKYSSSWNSILKFKKTTKNNISVGQFFECTIEIECLLEIAFSVKVKWLPADETQISLVSPQSLMNSSLLHVKSINNKIIFEIKFMANSVGKHDLGSLQFISPFNQIIYQMPLESIVVAKRFSPSFCEAPVSCVMKEFRQILRENNNKPVFYVITGEGGIGKSKLLENVRIYAINQRYRCINIEHTCNWENDENILFQILTFLCECEERIKGENLYQNIRWIFGGYFKTEWENDLQKFLNGESVKNDDVIIECIFQLLLHALENNPLCITFSNMHWASPFLLSILKVLIEYINDHIGYLQNKLLIVFEGRSEEKIHINYRNITPYDWLDFCKYNILKEIKLIKWTSKSSGIYIRSLFKQPQTLMENDELDNMLNLLLQYSSGNPMHINEMIKHMLSVRSLTLDTVGKLHILVSDAPTKFSAEILDVITMRIQYFVEKQPQLVDYLIILANLIQDDYIVYSKIVNAIFDELNIDSMAFVNEIGFIDVKNGIYYFTHEHYKTLLMQQKIYDYGVVEKFIYHSAESKQPLSGIGKIRLMLLKDIKSDLYMELIFDEIITYLRKSEKTFEQYALLQLLEEIPLNILQKKGYFLHKIYRFLIDGAMVIANYNEAKKYIYKLSELNDVSKEYFLNLVYARKMLSNINGLQMEMDDAISVGMDFISTMDDFFDRYNFKADNLQKEYILLYDRVAIEYYMAGQYQQSAEYHKQALAFLEPLNDMYVKYHILYEQGVRELHKDISLGIRHIEDSLNNIPIYDFMTETQEKDLILGDLLMGRLLESTNEMQIDAIKKQASERCNKLATLIKPFESILFHWIVGICHILQQNYKEAIRYFRISVIISAKTPIMGMLWKSYLNLAQAYFLLDSCETNKRIQNYQETAKYYILEAKEIIEDALECNVWTKKDFEKRLSYPISLINYLLRNSSKVDGSFKSDSPLHIDFNQYSFFMLD